MGALRKLLSLGVVGVLGACSTASTPAPAPAPTVSGSASNFGGTYSITQNGATRVLAAPSGTIAAISLDIWNTLVESGYMYEGADAIAIAVMDRTSYETFAGVSGVPATAVPTAGSASYTGAFSAVFSRSGFTSAPLLERGLFNMVVNFRDGSIVGVGAGGRGATLSVDGTLTGTDFNGTAQFSALEYTGAASVPMTGGLYGTGAATVAGFYQGDTVTGVFWGQ